MSDRRLRGLEREWRETGSVEAEAACLRERVRVGDLTQERLQLAACCGHEGARRAAGSRGRVLDPDCWLVDIERMDPAAGLFAAILLGRAVLPVWQAARPVDDRPALALAAAAHVLTGAEGAAERVGSAADAANDSAVELERRGDPRALSAACCISAIADLAAGARGSAEDVWECAVGALAPQDLETARSAIVSEVARRLLLSSAASITRWVTPE